MVRPEKKFLHPVTDRNIQQRIGCSNNNEYIEDLTFTVCICTFLHPVAQNFVGRMQLKDNKTFLIATGKKFVVIPDFVALSISPSFSCQFV